LSVFPRPAVVVSKCIGFAPCRYNGLIISDDFVASLRSHADLTPVCPEVEIGLGVPRDPIRLVSVEKELRLMQPAAGRDVSDEMAQFADSFLDSLGVVDGFVLKGRSPSCGIKDVKVFPSVGRVAVLAKDRGFFGRAVLDRFPHLPVEDEGRLRNFRIREHFLTRLFTLARFREVRASGKTGDLVRFQTENKLLLMAYNQKELRILGRIVANPEHRPVRDVVEDYQQHLYSALARMPRYTSSINVLLHALGFFSKGLTSGEKAFFLDTLEKYRAGRLPMSVLLGVLRSWIVRFEEPYLARQTFFAPYPEELVEITDSGKGRDY
jgi:uncharacterized protein YbgA (DUF1722 family)/uncharacterized protein YbbK (DUF523 family)